MTSIVLTDDQQAAYDNFAAFILDPCVDVFVLAGYSGTGKTTLVKTILDRFPSLMKTTKLINPDVATMDVLLTATTNKAAENFASIANCDVVTIHSALGLRVHTDYKTGVTQLTRGRHSTDISNHIIFIDEASYVDKELLRFIFEITSNCKIVFIGDPAQLVSVGAKNSPVFNAGYKGSQLSQVVRQAEGNPIIELSAKFRHTVNTGEFFSFKPDGVAIRHLSRPDFVHAIKNEFVDPLWHHDRSKVLAWTNDCVIRYNKAISNELTGQPELKVGDYAVCNRYMSGNGNFSIKTDQLVRITGISEQEREYGVLGNSITIDNRGSFFMPANPGDVKKAIKQAKDTGQLGTVAYIDNNWIDLRAAYACTINKAQGSTYGKVFIDLDDIKKCNSANQIARMLYVGVSRASHEVILTGDLI